MVTPDPLAKAKLFIAYVVAGVWAFMFLASVIRPPDDTTGLLAAQGAMMAIIGGLFVDRYLRKNGKG